MPGHQPDNSTIGRKCSLRRRALALVAGPADPVIMETHGGTGAIWRAVYRDVRDGIVFEKDSQKVDVLVKQRPTWSVYEAEVTKALAAGAGSHLTVTLLDLDPYGSCWDVLSAFFDSERPRARRLVVVVNDGLMYKLHTRSAWQVKALQDAVVEFGNDHIKDRYLEVSRWLLERVSAVQGYTVDSFSGYYCGAHRGMTHWLATLSQPPEEVPRTRGGRARFSRGRVSKRGSGSDT